jgi:leucyl aminopeptidase
MDIKVVAGDITQQAVGAIIVNLFQGVTAPGGATGAADSALDGAISRLIEEGETKGKRGEMTLVHTLGKMAPTRVLVAGLGESSDFTLDRVRSVTAESLRYLRRIGVESIATIAHGAGIGGLDARASGQAIAEGAVLGLYRLDKYKSGDKDRPNLGELTVVEFDADKARVLEDGVAVGLVISRAVNLSRDMINEPANAMTPTRMAEVALEVAQENGLEIEVLDRPQMAEMGMGALLGVAQGSEEPPKFIILRFKGDPDDQDNNLGLVGKGITFDSGGLDIKTASGMATMKDDMAGGASVISAMNVIGQLKPKINVTGIVAATENMVSGRAQRPGDIVRTMNGKTIEIDNTDAEGRLVLADAISYARSVGLTRLVDVATLTGAVVIALGKHCTGAFGNDQDFTDQVISAGERVGERIWPFPMYDEYREQYRSDFADIKNTGGRGAGSITGAQIIGEFADGASWVHLDIAGTALSDKNKGYNPKGATGIPVRTLINLAQTLGKK